MTYFRWVRIYSGIEAALFTALVVVAVGHISKHAVFVLGLTHGIGWIVLCLLVARGAAKRIFPWPLLAATVSPLGPIGCTLGFELIVRDVRPRVG